MKFYKKAVILVIVASLLFIVCLINYKGDTGNTASAGEPIRLLNVNSDDIVRIELNNKGGSFRFEKESDSWKAVEPVNLKFDISRINGILFAVSNLDMEDVIDKQPSDLKQYGLTNPASIDIKTKDNAEYKLEIGNVTPYGDGYYVKKKNESAVYKANYGLCSEFMREKLDFRDRRLFDMPIEDYTDVTIKKKDKVVLDINKNGAVWNITEPVYGNSDLNGIEPVISMLSYLCVNDYVEDDSKDFGKYGLNNPSYAISIRTDKVEKTLFLGNLIEGKEAMYAKLSDSNDVFELLSKDLYLMDNPVKELSIYAFAEPFGNVSGIKLEMDNKITDIEIDTDKSNGLKKYYVNGRFLNMTDSGINSLFMRFYQTLNGIGMAETDMEYKSGKNPEITLTYELNSKASTEKIEFVPKNDTSYYVIRNGKYTGMLVFRSTFEGPEGIRDYCNSLIKVAEY
jgi:hypothetical protein